MTPESALTLDEIDLSDLAFWARPWSEREGAFQLLRRGASAGLLRGARRHRSPRPWPRPRARATGP